MKILRYKYSIKDDDDVNKEWIYINNSPMNIFWCTERSMNLQEMIEEIKFLNLKSYGDISIFIIYNLVFNDLYLNIFDGDIDVDYSSINIEIIYD